jgi:Heparinase II/III-like protein/Secretion system C-terminal sorting domain
VQNSINQYWHFFQPDGITINWGDGFTRISSDRVIYRHAQIFDDPRSQWLAQKMSIPANITWTWPRFQILIYKDFTAAPIAEPDPPHDWFSDKTGLSVSRTGWDSAAAVVWTYNAPTKKSSHDHRDNNTFCVVKNKPQIIHSGYYNSYGNSHYVNYYQRTIAHNSICVFDSADAYTNWGVPVSNDGGQIESPTLMNYAQIFTPAAQKGKWILWGSESQYCYTIADAALSYDSAKLDTFMRRTFFHKPGRLLVLDHLHLRNTATEQRDVSFILHFQNQPAISGNLLNALVPGHIEKFDGADVTQTNGNGNVAIRTLLPQNASITRVGGAGYEYFVNGVNYPVGSTVDSVNTTPGKWRIETRPPATVERPVFFHTIKIGDNVSPSTPGGVLNQTAFTIGADWENTLYFFNAKGDTSVDYHRLENVPGGRTVEIVAADLLPNWAYGVFVDGTVQSTLIADTNGVCIGTLPIAPGTHVVELFASLEAVEESATDLGLKVYPNPAGDEFSVERQKSSGRIALQLIDVQGKVWVRTTMKEQLTISSRTFPSGIYFLEAEGESGKQVLRVVIAH